MIVTVNDRRYIDENFVILALASEYAKSNDCKLCIARMCDDILDRSGRLLGLVRDKSVEISKLDIS